MREDDRPADVDTGVWDEAHCRDMGFLEARSRELGLRAVERALRQAACAYGGVVAAIHRALQAEAHVLRQDIRELPVRIYNRLRCSGWDAAQIENALRFPAGLPVPRLRHPVSMPIAEVVFEGHKQGIWACATTRDGRVISASRDRTLRVWDLESGEQLAVLWGHDDEVRDCAVMPDGRRVVSASSDGSLRIWDLDTGRPITRLAGHRFCVLACAVTSDGRRIVSASRDGTLRIWDSETGGTLAVLKGHNGQVRDCAITPDDRRIVSVSYDGLLKVWSLETGELLATLDGPGCWLTSCAVSPNGALVIAATHDGPLQSWDLETLQFVTTFHGHLRGPDACLVTPDGRHLIAPAFGWGCSGNTVRVWELATGKELATVEVGSFGHGDVVLDLAWAPDGQHIVSASWDSTLRLWSFDAALAHGVAPREATPRYTTASVTSDGQRLVARSAKGDIASCSWGDPAALARFDVQLPKREKVFGAMAVGERRAVVETDHALVAVDLDARQAIGTLAVQHAGIQVHGFARGDRWVVFFEPKERGILVWDLDTGKILGLADARRLGCVTLPAQRCAIVERSIVVWDEDGRIISTRELTNKWPVTKWIPTQDGRRLVIATGSNGRFPHEVRVADASSAEVEVTLETPAFKPFTILLWLAVTPDARRIIGLFWGGYPGLGLHTRIIVWDASTGALVGSTLCGHILTGLTTTNDVACAIDRWGTPWFFDVTSAAQDGS